MPLACRRCRCRIVTKIGKGRKRSLICADCGLPMDPGVASDQRKRLLAGSLALILFSLLGGVMLFLGAMNEQRHGGGSLVEPARERSLQDE